MSLWKFISRFRNEIVNRIIRAIGGETRSVIPDRLASCIGMASNAFGMGHFTTLTAKTSLQFPV